MSLAPSWFSMRRSAGLVALCYSITAGLGFWLSHELSHETSHEIFHETDHRGFFQLAAGKGDNTAYIGLTRSLLDGNYRDPTLDRHRQLSLGTAILVAGVSTVTRLDPVFALPLTCWIAAALSWFVICRLYDPTVAALALCINIGIIERSIYGGPEAPLLLACCFSLLLWRRGGYPAVCAAAATMAFAAMLRPSALVFLGGAMLVLLLRRSFPEIAITAAIVLPLLALYLLLLRNPATAVNPVTGYRDFWYSGSPVSFPLWPIVNGIVHTEEPPTIFLKELPYILMILAAVLLAIRHFRSLAADFPFDLATFLFSAWFIFSYNSFAAFEEFHRYCLLAVPTACFLLWRAFRTRIPAWTVTALCVFFSVASALSTAGLRESFAYLRSLVR